MGPHVRGAKGQAGGCGLSARGAGEAQYVVEAGASEVCKGQRRDGWSARGAKVRWEVSEKRTLEVCNTHEQLGAMGQGRPR